MDENNINNSPTKPVISLNNVCKCCNKYLIIKNHPVLIFGAKVTVELREIIEFLHGSTIKPDDVFPKKICQPCYRDLQKMVEFRRMCQETVAAQETVVAESRVKRGRLSQSVI